ncbi:MAG TPA: hypothetical protein VHD76_21310 [Bryobacteraceae bacterium]|jgi:hypothetical protein|nr:hypothetical protein [Bryobacteraceae bacterium]
MEEIDNRKNEPGLDIPTIIRNAVEEFARAEQKKAEPAYKAELIEERKRREALERRLNELVEENQKTRAAAEEADRSSTIRAELQKLGVAKVDLAFRAVKDEIARGEDGRLIARGGNGEIGLKDYLTQFVAENPELLPARMTGGSGAGAPSKTASGGGSGVSLDQIRPGMSPEELQRAREEIYRVAAQTLRGR